MQKFCSIFLVFALVATHEALPQTKWSRPIRNPQGQLVRERRQFPFGEWIPLNQACPTCRQLADPLDVGLRSENIGLKPPRPPTVTRQVHSEGNFFPQDESSILSVPPPPPSAIPRHPSGNTNGNFQNVQFSGFSTQFNNPLPTQQIFPQTQQIQFLPQTFLSNQQLLVNGNQQVLPVVNNQNTLFGQENQGKQQITNGKVPKFNSEFKTQKVTENIVLEQNKRPAVQQSSSQFSNKPTPFTLPQQQQAFEIQQQQQTFSIQNQQQQQNFRGQQQQNFGGQQQQNFGGQQQSFGVQQQQQQKQHSANFGDSILTPPPAPHNASQNIVIPGLDKEEIQLLYVPVETLRQRGTLQEQLLTQEPQNIQFHNRPSPSQRPATSLGPTVQTTTKLPKGHFVTHGENQAQSLSSLKVTSSQPFPSTVTPSTLLLQQLPFKQTPQPFVSATPATPTIQPFITSSPAAQKFTSFTPETTLPHLVTIPNTIQFSQSDLEFGTTPKSILNQEAFQNQIISGKSQFSDFKDFQNVQQQQRPLQPQSFVTQQPQGERQTQKITSFLQEQQKEFEVQNQISNQKLINQQQAALQKQQEQHLQEQYLLKQRQQKELEAERLLQQQKQKELEEQRYLQQQRQKELEEQQRLQQKRQKELEEQRFLQQQREKELEQARFLQLQKEKELENQRRLQLQRQKELEEKRRLQQIRQKEEEQRILRIQQQQKEQEEQRLLRIQQQQKELEEQRLLRIQQQQKELEEQRLLRIKQQQQKELEEQRLLRQRQEEEQRLLRQRQEQQLLQQRQQQENFKKQQQIPFYQQQPKQQFPQQPTRHTLPVNDKLNSISQLAKESESDQQLVPHQPPLSVFYKGADAGIVDVLKELRSSRTVTVLDQYFDKMPKVFVGPAGLIPPAGYERFELPYLSNIETNRIERKIDRLPFFVAPLNFVPPPGYAKIPFPAPHVGSVVVSSETNPAMKLVEKEHQTGSVEENGSGSYPVVGPELPGLINSLETETTTLKPVTISSTPSLPQTTAQLRNRKPNNNLYRTQSRKPVSKRPQTTARPEEVTQPIQKAEVSKESEVGLRKPFNRFLNRRRQQSRTTTTTTTTEIPVRIQQDGKNFENRHYSVDIYNQQQNINQLPVQQQKGELYQGQKLNNQFQYEAGSIDRTTPNGHAAFGVSPTPDFHASQPAGVAVESDENRSGVSEYSDINFQTFEDGPLPTGSAKTITQELYRPNAIKITDQQRFSDISSKIQPKQEESEKYQHSSFGFQGTTQLGGISEVNPTSAFVSPTAQTGSHSDEVANIIPTPNTEYENQEVAQVNSEKYYSTEQPRTENPFTSGSVTPSGQQQTVSFGASDDQFTSVFAEISKHQHFPTSTESSNRQYSNFASRDVQPTPQISFDLQAPYSKELSQEQNSQEFLTPGDVRQTQKTEYSNNKFLPTGTSNEQYLTSYEAASKNQEGPDFVPTGSVDPTVPGVSQEQYTTGFSENSNTQEVTRNSEEERRPSFIQYQGISNTQDSSVDSQSQYYPSSTESQTQEFVSITENVKNVEQPEVVEQSYPSVTPETVVSVTENSSPQTYKEETVSEDSVHINDQSLTTEDQGQNFGDNLSYNHRLKLPNPSIVRVRTRHRGKPRGQVNFAASQSTTPAPIIRSRGENRYTEKASDSTSEKQEYSTKASVVRDYQPIKTSKYNQYRGLKKPVRTTTTTEATTEYEQKANIYTIRPPRRPPSTVSTKRIRRPTTPVSTAEAATESFGISTPGAYSRPEDSEFPPSGVSNDVYYEHTSLSPIRQKFRKHFGSLEQKSDVVPVYSSTAFPSTEQYYPTATQEEYVNEEVNVEKDLPQAVSVSQENSEVYPDWNPSESGIDVSGIILTTVRSPVYEEQHEEEEPKKTSDSKKAFDPDLEKKNGRRRVRVRVHKRPHENFETAESQNLRTVANVLVPPTSTYKPIDDTNIHQLAKNSDFSFGGQKLFGARSREYFRKRLNITRSGNGDLKQGDATKEEEHSGAAGEGSEKVTGTKVLTYVKKIQKGQNNDYVSSTAPSSEGNGNQEDGRILRTKHRGYVRKIIKHKGVSKEVDSELSHGTENENHEEKNADSQSRHPFRVNHEGVGQNGRLNGTRHRTFVRYVKKNKIRPHSTEAQQETTSEETQQKENQGILYTTEYVTETSSQEQQSQGEQVSQQKQITESENSQQQTTESGFSKEQQGSQLEEHEQRITQSGVHEQITQSGEQEQITQSGEREQHITQSGEREQQITQSGVQEQQTTQSGEQEQQITQSEANEQQEETESKTSEQGQRQKISGLGYFQRQRQQQTTESGAQEQQQGGFGLLHRQRQQQIAHSGQQQIIESGAQEQQLTGFGLLQRHRQQQITQSGEQQQTKESGAEEKEETESKTSEQGQRQKISGLGYFQRQRQQQIAQSGQQQITESEAQEQQQQQQGGFGLWHRQRTQQITQSGQQRIIESGAQEQQQQGGFGLLQRQRQQQITQSRILQRQQQQTGTEISQQTNESETSQQQPTEAVEFNTSQQSVSEQSQSEEHGQGLYPVYENGQQSQTVTTEEEESKETQRSDVLRGKQSAEQQTEQPEIKQIQQSEIQTSQNSEDEKALDDVTITDEYKEIEDSILHQVQTASTSSLPTQKPKFFRTGFQRPPYTGFQRSKESLTHSSTTERAQEVQEKRDGAFRPKYGKTSGFGGSGNSKYEEVRKANEFKSEQQLKNKNQHTLEVRKYIRTKTREGAFSQFSKNRYYTSEKTEAVATTENHDEGAKEVEEYSTPVEKTTLTKFETVRVESPATESRFHTTQLFAGSTDSTNEQTETTKIDEDSELHLTTTEAIENSTEEESDEEDETDTSTTVTETTTEAKTEVPTTYRTFKYKVVESSSETKTEVPTTYQTFRYEVVESSPETKTEVSPTVRTSKYDSVENLTEIKTEVPTTSHESSAEEVENLTETKTVGETVTEKVETHYTDTQPDLYRFSKSSFSFDEAGKFTGIKNRAHVRNITANIIESTASFSAPGVEKRVVPPTNENSVSQTETFRVEVTHNDKTEDTTTEYNTVEPTTEYPERIQTETTAATDSATKAKIAKLIKTSTTTKISHETEICYKGKCIRTKAENPDEDLKLLVDTANIMKIEKAKT